jgi:hypothetical protein
VLVPGALRTGHLARVEEYPAESKAARFAIGLALALQQHYALLGNQASHHVLLHEIHPLVAGQVNQFVSLILHSQWSQEQIFCDIKFVKKSHQIFEICPLPVADSIVPAKKLAWLRSLLQMKVRSQMLQIG